MTQQFTEAEEYLLGAIEICRSTIPAAAGAFMGSLAWLYAQQSKMIEARTLLVEGEPLVASIPIEHGQFLCTQSKILHMVGEFNQAEESLEQARVIAQKVNSGKNSELGKLITETEQFLSSASLIESKESSSSGLVAKEVSDESNQQSKIQADMLVEQGDLDETQSLYDEALVAYKGALEIYSTLEDAPGIIKVYLRIANIQYHVGNLEMSRKGCIDALKLAESNRLHDLKADVLTQLVR